MRTIIFLSVAFVVTAINLEILVFVAFLAFGWDMIEIFYNRGYKRKEK